MMTDKLNDKSMISTEASMQSVKCTSCRRVLKTPQERMTGDQTVLCDQCYQDLMFLHPTKGHQDVMH